MSNAQGPVLVIGATGRQGFATATSLLEKGWPVRAFVRDPEAPKAQELKAAGAELAVGDLDDEDSLRAAMEGVHGAFLMLTMMEGVHITPKGIADEERRGKSVAELAAKAGVAHLVYTSLQGVYQGSGVEYYDAKEHIEDHIRALGLPATFLRPVMFMDNLATYNRPTRDGDNLILALPVPPDMPMQFIAIDDIGRFAALAFERPADFLGRALVLAGDELTPTEIAETLARKAGLTPRTFQVPLEQISAFDEQVGKMFAFFNARPNPPVDLAALRADLPGLMTLEDWMHATDWQA
ncbi:NmrA/HSCARG family protein [Nocardia sp. NPDC004722]